MFKQLFSLVIGLMLFAACSKTLYVEEKPITFGETRKALTLNYLQEHYGLEQQQPTITPKMVVVHWTAIPTFQKTFEVFNPPTLRGSRPDIQNAGALNVSSHYLIDRKGRIAQLMPDTVMARHVIGLNHAAIGIENVGSDKRRLTVAQLRANTRLIKKLANKYDIEYVIGHYEYKLFEGHELWKELDDGYRTDKIDPGAVFMMRLRDRLENLNLKGPPKQTGPMKK